MSADVHYVTFDGCHHVAWLLDEEYGDGSAWCQTCGAFRCYEDRRLREARPVPYHGDPGDETSQQP